jgi:hypothetical protein
VKTLQAGLDRFYRTGRGWVIMGHGRHARLLHEPGAKCRRIEPTTEDQRAARRHGLDSECLHAPIRQNRDFPGMKGHRHAVFQLLSLNAPCWRTSSIAVQQPCKGVEAPKTRNPGKDTRRAE